ncbi:hypothetical protein N825_28915 [Skermanella stibiiresistens SB22]|uniref:Uncharacterized protein n=1 Tax=Skermanella stibiiresistens SB22 TaxID=1385369 RepID=W9GUG1_9PROT|nr:hypothetical protein [Skermanella stibiiresistens]EWY36296.1 hypothetical protein N825_28915 [Skermanella stibiiresistens SB22]
MPLPDNGKQLADAQAAIGGLASARQRLAQATATKLPSMSMDELRRRITDLSKGKCG